MNYFGFSLNSVDISAWLITMLIMLMMLPSSTNGFKIYVSLPVEVEDTDTVAILKQKIAEMTKIPPEQQTIRSKDNPNGHLLVEEKKLKEYKISKNSYLYLGMESPLEITVRLNGSLKSVFMKGTDTVKTLKQKIKPIIEKPFGNFIGEIKLRRHTNFGTHEIWGRATLDECGINEDSRIDVT
ncbi:hypothetical protein niasHS_008984 [Heterodera schachtii]|uniref:Ubiquitin-like domain-containing protein n=2 Tax=Heterodera TaxID=34509 RepID=A0ABD2J1G1_HETSC